MISSISFSAADSVNLVIIDPLAAGIVDVNEVYVIMPPFLSGVAFPVIFIVFDFRAGDEFLNRGIVCRDDECLESFYT